MLDKIQALISRAAHPETPVEEARTSAVIAVKLIVDHKIELVDPGTVADNEIQSTIDDLFNDFFSNFVRPKRRRSRRKSPPVKRTVYTAHCPAAIAQFFRCECCGAPVRPGQRIHWVDGEELDFATKVTHDVCSQHWAQKDCVACKKNTVQPQKRKTKPPPGVVEEVATSTGYCFCCGGVYDVDTRVQRRGFVCVHERCAQHFTSQPCRLCGGAASM